MWLPATSEIHTSLWLLLNYAHMCISEGPCPYTLCIYTHIHMAYKQGVILSHQHRHEERQTLHPPSPPLGNAQSKQGLSNVHIRSITYMHWCTSAITCVSKGRK